MNAIHRITGGHVVPVLVMAIVAVSACGGSSSAKLSGTYNVGVLTPLSGPAAFVGDWYQHGVNVALNEVNNNGSFRLQAVYGDTSNDPVDAVNAYHQVQLQSPEFWIGPSGAVASSVIPLFDPANQVDFTLAGDVGLDHMPYKHVFRLSPSDSVLTVAMAAYALNKHLMNAVMMFSSGSSQQSEVPLLSKAYTANGGKVLGTFVLSVNATDYRSELTQAFALKPDVIFFSVLPPQAQSMFTNWRQLGLPDVPWVGDDTVDINTAKAIGLATAAKDVIGLSGSAPSGSAYSHFLDVYSKVWGTRQPIQQSANIYDSIIIAALAMTAAGSSDPNVWVNDIIKVSNPPGTMCYTYATCVALLTSGTKINYEGAVGSDDFNQYHNIFSDYDAIQFDASGNVHTVLTITQSQLAQMAG